MKNDEKVTDERLERFCRMIAKEKKRITAEIKAAIELKELIKKDIEVLELKVKKQEDILSILKNILQPRQETISVNLPSIPVLQPYSSVETPELHNILPDYKTTTASTMGGE